MTTLNDALNRLADLYEYGALKMSTDAAGFINMVCDDIEKARELLRSAPSVPAATKEEDE